MITARAARVGEKGDRELGTRLADSIHGLGLALLQRVGPAREMSSLYPVHGCRDPCRGRFRCSAVVAVE